MISFPAVLLVLAAQHPNERQPREIVRAATDAVERGGTTPLSGSWDAAIAQDSSDRTALLGRATLARLTYDYALAEGLYHRLTIPSAPADAIAVYAHLGVGAAALSQGQFARSDSLFRRGGTAARGLRDSGAEAEAILGQATAQARLVGAAQALTLLDQGARLVPADAPELALGYRCRRALLLATIGRPEAAPEGRRGIIEAERLGSFGLRGLCHHALARHFERTNDDSAAAALGRAAADFRRVNDRARLAAILQGRGYSYISTGEFGLALVDLHAALDEARISRSPAVDAWASLNLAQVLIPFGDLPAARTHLARAESLLAAQGDQYGLFVLKGTRGWLLELAGDTAAARQLYVTGIRSAARFSPHTAYLFHRRLAVLALKQENYPSARAHLDTARAGYRRLGMKPWDDFLNYFYGTLALAEGDLIGAEADLRRHLSGTDSTQRGHRYLTLVRLAEVLARQGRVTDAEALLGAATDSLERWRAALSRRDLRLLSFEMRSEESSENVGAAAVVAASVRAGRTAQAFFLAERYRAREMLDRLVERDAIEIRSPTEVVPPPPSPTTAAQVRAALPRNVAVLSFVTGEAGEPTTVFVISREGIRGYVLAAPGTYAGDIARLERIIAARRPLSRPARRLGELLLDSALSAVPASVTHLSIIPDGPLHRAPFETLLLANGRPLGDAYSMGLAPSATVLLRLQALPSRTDSVTLLAFGDPFYPSVARLSPGASQGLATAFRDAGGLPRLPETAREAHLVGGYTGRSDVWLGEDASEARLKNTRLGRYRVLHFAVHGLVDDRSDLRTALALAPGAGEDGFVTPADLSQLRLDADLVVLSACRTAEGTVLGNEGRQGLTASLLEAGARAVVATRWPVQDRGPRRMIDALYRGLSQGLTVGESLREARRAAIARGAPMHEWAAFTLIGDPMLRIPLRASPSPAPHWTWAVAAVAVALAALAVRRRYRRRGEPLP